MFDVVIRGARIVDSESVRSLDVGIVGGVIAALLEPGTEVDSAETIDAAGLLAIPGGIDTHTHVQWPYDGKVTVDDFGTASRAAALGGTTTIIDFVPPPTGDATLYSAALARIELAKAQGVMVDYALHSIVTSASRQVLEDIPRVIDAGVTSFKMYTTFEGRRINDSEAFTLMQAIAGSGGLPGFHAENDEIIEGATAAQDAHGHTHPEWFADSRPAMAEVESIQMVGLYARRIGTPVWIYHVSGADALDVILDARRLGTEIFAETCAHYLTFADEVYHGDESWRFVICPPIRGARDRDALWDGVRTGAITSIATDHCAYDLESKIEFSSDHRHIPAGAPGIGARGPAAWDRGINQEHVALTDFVAAWAENAAKAQGLFPAKGVLAVGSDADIALWDPEATWQGSDLPEVPGGTFSLYTGLAGKGRPRHVLRRGEFLVRDGEFVGEPGTGRFLARPRRTAS